MDEERSGGIGEARSSGRMTRPRPPLPPYHAAVAIVLEVAARRRVRALADALLSSRRRALTWSRRSVCLLGAPPHHTR